MQNAAHPGIERAVHTIHTTKDTELEPFFLIIDDVNARQAR
jgi:hypothetical protein